MTGSEQKTANPYSLPQPEKESFLVSELSKLTRHHKERCPDYARLLHLFYSDRMEFHRLDEIPYLPVNLFKTKKLLSIPPSEVFKVLRSSGTTSIQQSMIFLDAQTAHRQTVALADIMTSVLGPKRLPMVVLDHPNVIADKALLSARGAALIGMLTFGRDICYAFDERMVLDLPQLQTWLKNHQKEPLLLFGLTFVIWKYFLPQLWNHEIDLSNAILMHTGGWKKLADESIDNDEFKRQVASHTGIRRCYNFYGTVEQIGTVFVECDNGYLHCPQCADVIIRDPKSWTPQMPLKPGVIQLLSTLPLSYPGHSLLTEDMGVIQGVDDCPCGRKGQYFHVLGRVPSAEIRGCSDTFTLEKS